jgi:acyl-CoA dehydrogenase
MCKVFCSEALGRVVDRSLQVLGSIGITRDTVVERIYRDIRPFRIYDGPSEVHRHALARRIVSRNLRRQNLA